MLLKQLDHHSEILYRIQFHLKSVKASQIIPKTVSLLSKVLLCPPSGLPCLALPYLALLYLALPYLTLPYLTLPYLACLTLPCLALHCKH